MTYTNGALDAAISAAERLPMRLRRELAERLLASTTRERTSITVQLRRLSKSKQSRLAVLLDKSSDGALSRTERAELRKLGKEADEIMLSNSIALAGAARPELFDARGQLIKSRFRQAFSSSSTDVKSSRREIRTGDS